MITIFKVIVGSGVLAAILDYLWIGKVVGGLYQNQIGGILRKTNSVLAPNIPSTIAVYIIIGCLIAFFVLPIIPSDSSYLKVFGYGALFGFLAYSFYDLTNYALLSAWPLYVSVVDIVWGTVMIGIVTTVAYWITRVSA